MVRDDDGLSLAHLLQQRAQHFWHARNVGWGRPLFQVIVEHLGSGYLAKSRSPAELAEGLRFVLSDRERNARLGEAARRLAVARYDSGVVATRYLEAYRQALLHFEHAR